MNPKRALLPVAIALSLVACTASAAQAEVLLSDSEGSSHALKKGAKVTATSTNLVTTRSNGTKISCGKVTLHLELIDPGPAHLELKQLGAATTSTCILYREALGLPNLPMTVDDATIGGGAGNMMTINTSGTGTTNSTFQTTVFADAEHKILAAACDFTGTVDLVATESSDELTVTPSPLIDGVCGEGTIHGDFTLETSDDTPVTTHFDEEEIMLTESSEALEPGAKVRATSTDLAITFNSPSSLPRIACESMTLQLEVLTNGPTNVVLKQIEGGATTKGCHLLRSIAPETLPATLTDGTIGVGEESKMTLNTWGIAKTTATFASNVYSNSEHKLEQLLSSCHLTGSLQVLAAGEEEDVLDVPGSAVTATPDPLCSVAGGQVHGSFTLETSNGSEVRTDFVQT